MEREARLPHFLLYAVAKEDHARLDLRRHLRLGIDCHPAWFRLLPWLLTVLSANLLHYRSLLQTRAEARAQAERSAADVAPPLSFSLMNSSSMRLVRYKIKLFRYSATLIYLLLFWSFIPEINLLSEPGWGTVDACTLGLLAGTITIYLNENRAHNMRNAWKPSVDFQSASHGSMWDMLRITGGTLLVPFEEELFYHSWLYRLICQLWSREKRYNIFTDVPFNEWNWGACIAANGFLALYNGQEWRSAGLCGLIYSWAIARRGHFMDGVLAHAICNLVISVWVLWTGQRQFW